MSEQSKHIEISKQVCIDFETMKAYLRNELSDAEMHRLEQHMLSCAFCADAFEGLSEAEHLENHFLKIQGLKTEISNKASKTKVLRKSNKRPFYMAAMAAAVMILFGIAYLFQTNKLSESNKTAMNEQSKVIAEKQDSSIVSAAIAEPIDSSKDIKPENHTTISVVKPTIHEELAINTNPKEKQTEAASSSNQNDIAKEENTTPYEEAAEVTNSQNTYMGSKAEATRTLNKKTENNTTNLPNTENMLKLLNDKVAQKDNQAALNIIYELEHSADAQKLKLRLSLTRARIFAVQYNKKMGVNYLKSIKDSEITSTNEYRILLDSLSK
jgi:hypothetical protein